MKITHNIALSVDESAKQKFEALGIQLNVGFSSFKIDESDPRWAEVDVLARSLEAVDTAKTDFSAKELNDSDYLRLVGDWHHGYPEPSEDFGYLSEVYCLDKYCSECGSGLIQKSPFKFSKEPKWGTKDILQLNWVFDEFFVRPDTWENLFKPLGVECREVLHAKSGKPLETVVQLIVPEEDVSLSLKMDTPGQVCAKCSVTKYLPIVRGFFPALTGVVKTPIFKVKDNFGSGAESHKPVLITKDLYSVLKQNKVKGVAFYPLLKID